jgi:hypothetical protein
MQTYHKVKMFTDNDTETYRQYAEIQEQKRVELLV